MPHPTLPAIARHAVMAATLGLFAGCSCRDEAPAPAPAAPAAAPAPVDEPPTSAAEDPRPGPFVRGVRGGPLLRLGRDHSGELVVHDKVASLHVIHRSRSSLPATGEVSLRIKPETGDEMALVMTPDAAGARWTVAVPRDPGKAEAIVTMQINGETVTGAVYWSEAASTAPGAKTVELP